VIVVDSSVWIGHLRHDDRPAVVALRSITDPDEIIVGDLILFEVLRGARDERHAATIEHELRQFRTEPMLGELTAITAARHYRYLRRSGFTVRKTADLIIATFCIENGYALLHDDRDFDPLVDRLGLRVVETPARP
jgi:hypothetical protein